MENKIKNYDKLKSRVYVTRVSRINYSERLLKKGKYWDFINFIYTIYLVGLSILGLKEEIATENYSLFVLFLSVSLAMVTLYSNSMNYKGRAERIKINYLFFHKLYQRLDRIDPSNENEFKEVEVIEDEYFEELKTTENHGEVDWYNAIKNDSYEKDKVEGRCFLKIKSFILSIIDELSLTLFVVAIPILVLIFY